MSVKSNDRKPHKEGRERIDVFLIVSLFNSLYFFVKTYIDRGIYLNWAMLNAENQFSDYFIQIARSTDRIHMYDYGSPFPPFAYCIYYILWRLNGTNEFKATDWISYKYHGNNLTIFLVFTIIQIIVLNNLVNYILKNNSIWKNMALVVLLSVSYPFFATCLQRGNSTLLSAIIMLASFLFLSFNERIMAEWGIVFIAIATGLKMTPIVCGIQLLKKRDWKAIIRLAIYTAFIFFMPFAFFGGTASILKLIEKYSVRVGTTQPNYCTFKGLFQALLIEWGNINTSDALGYASVLSNIMLVLLVVGFFITKERWKEVLYISGIVTAYIPTGWMYTSIYMICPLIFMLAKQKQLEHKNRSCFIYAILFGFIFSMSFPLLKNPIYGIHGGIYILITLLLLIALIETFYKFLKDRYIKEVSI